MSLLSKRVIAIIAADGFDEFQLFGVLGALKDSGARIDIISTMHGQIEGGRETEKKTRLQVDRVIGDTADADHYDALFLPGGVFSVDYLRTEKGVMDFILKMQGAEKPIATMDRAPWLLISAGIVRGRTLTSHYSIQDDIKNAGGVWIDRDVVVHQNWVTSRSLYDLPTFISEMIKLFSHDAPLMSQEVLREIAKARIA
jgi:protease I